MMEPSTITGKVKVANNDIMTFDTKDEKTYVLNSGDDDVISVLKARKNKELIVTGIVNEKSNVMDVIQIGGMDKKQKDK